MKIFRFILIIPVAILVWYLTFFIGLLTLKLAVKYFCEYGSGLICYDPGWKAIKDLLVIIFTGISAGLIVITTAIIAPDRKLNICIGIYFSGVLVALIFALMLNHVWLPFTSAIFLGAVSLFLVKRRLTMRCKTEVKT